MKTKLIAVIMMAMTVCGASAENLLQVLPQSIVAGSTSADGRSIMLQMNNDEVFTAFQFDIYLPDGVDLDDYAPVVLSSERFPNRPGRPNPIYSHVIDARKHDGFWRVIVYSTTNEPINGHDGDLLYLYYVSDADLPSEPLPLRISNVVMAISGTEDVKPADCSSYLYTESVDFSAIAKLDLSGLDGYVPHDVVEKTNELIEGNSSLNEVNISGIDDAGADFVISNPNCLLYVDKNSAIAERIASMANVVSVSTEGNTCSEYQLTDGYPINVSLPFTAKQASYHRVVSAPGWYSLCLPFAASIPDGVSVERLSAFDSSKGTLTFVPYVIEANLPCIFNTTFTDLHFIATDVYVEQTPSVMLDAEFNGTYNRVNAGSITGCYALFPDGSGFGRAGQTAYVDPFRAYINVYSGTNIIHLIHSETSSIDNAFPSDLRIVSGEGQLSLIAGVEPCDVVIYNITGCVEKHIKLEAGQMHSLALKSGVYIINKTKIVVK